MRAEAGDTPIRARRLAKSYGLLPVLRDVDLDVERGDCLALLGANGAGKSTLLRVLGGISRATRGELALFGASCRPERAPAEVLARIGFVGHEPLVYRDLTPRQNLEFFARLHAIGASASERADRVGRALEEARLERSAGRDVRTLSRGTLQRLALARATLHDPELLLLDEPFTGLDAPGRDRFADALRRRHDAGTTIVLISHDLSEVAGLATGAVVLRAGRVAETISPVPPLPELALRYRALVDDGPRDVGDRP